VTAMTISVSRLHSPSWRSAVRNVRAMRPNRAIAVLLVVVWGIFLAEGVPIADATPDQLGASGSTVSVAPEILTEFPGTFSAENSPPSTTVAASPTRVVQLTNLDYAITNRAKGTTTQGTMSQLVKTTGVFLSDEEVIWDPLTRRFYFSVFENRGSTGPQEGIAWGFSKTASPSSAAGFCSYFDEFNYGATSFPDRQSLGDTEDFLLIGSNRFLTANEAEVGSDVAWISKPPAGSKCPAQSSFRNGIHNLGRAYETAPFVPVPARQVDSNATGWVLATPCCEVRNVVRTLSSLDLIKVSMSTDGEAQFGATESVPVPNYSSPPLVPQAGRTIAGNTPPPLQSRMYFTQVTAAYDPRLGHEVLWAAHAIAGGAGAEVRWYEINPATASVDQYGTVSDPRLFLFNATISPDRLVNGRTKAFGSNSVLTVNTASVSSYAAIQMVGITGGQLASGLVLVQQSPGPDADFSCFEPHRPECRWGDDSGATPDPGAPRTGATGDVWLTNQWNEADINDETPVWRTTVWRAAP
jgi:hypothetical protein